MEEDLISQIGIISLTTLDTPHHGSVLSDMVVASRDDPAVLPLIARVEPGYYFIENSSFFGAGNEDLTVSAVTQGFNRQYDSPPNQFTFSDSANPPNLFKTTPKYYSTASDADLD